MANKKKYRILLKPVFLHAEVRGQVSDATIDAAIARVLERITKKVSPIKKAKRLRLERSRTYAFAPGSQRNDVGGWVSAKHIKKASSGKRSKASRAHAS
jgi:hypothetical protein